jgi:hypothetical protein
VLDVLMQDRISLRHFGAVPIRGNPNLFRAIFRSVSFPLPTSTRRWRLCSSMQSYGPAVATRAEVGRLRCPAFRDGDFVELQSKPAR